MTVKPVFCSIAAVALLLAASQVRATPMYYSVDSSTGGPISLNVVSANYSSITDQETFDYQAVNSSGTTFPDVEFLNDFVLNNTPYPSNAVPMTYNTGTQTWSDLTYGDSWHYTISPTNTLPMDDTNLPLSYTNYGATANIAGTDAAPYVDVGPVGPFGTVGFTEVATLSPSGFTKFDAAGAFISTVPEPSTLVLFGAGAVGGLFFFGRRRRAATI